MKDTKLKAHFFSALAMKKLKTQEKRRRRRRRRRRIKKGQNLATKPVVALGYKLV